MDSYSNLWVKLVLGPYFVQFGPFDLNIDQLQNFLVKTPIETSLSYRPLKTLSQNNIFFAQFPFEQ